MKMRYTERSQIGLTDNSISLWKVAGNSVYDCNPQLSSRQYAYLFLEYAQFYSEYTVTSSSISITFDGLAGNPAFAICIYPHYSTTLIDGWRNWPGRKMRAMGSQVATNGVLHMRHYATTKKVYHLINDPPKIEFYSGGAGAFGAGGSDPINIWYWHVVFDNADNEDQPDINILLKMTYYVTFFNRRGSVYATEG